ncbi:MAG: phosphate acetyltransferase [Candidatus Gracilibacteria bacterium]
MEKTKKDILAVIKTKAKKIQSYIAYPEALDPRTLEAMEMILEEETARPLLIAGRKEIETKIQEFKLKLNPDRVQILDPADPQLMERYIEELYRLRKEKGMTKDEASELMKDPNYIGVMAVHLKEADGMISGAVGTTAMTARPALQIIGTKEKFHKVSGLFFMIFENRLLFFADCAITPDPNSHDLADIAIDTAETAKRFGIEPKIAMLSFSTNGSAKHPMADKVKEATALVKDRRPDLKVDGEMQVDAALVPWVGKQKFPNSQVQGDANILIFPSLEAGNIAYKLVERLAGAKAIGPMLQGLAKPINDLSRGCTAEDIADLSAITSCESVEAMYEFDF